MAADGAAEGEAKVQAPPVARGRLLARLGLLVVRHAGAVSLVCCLAGIVALMLLPVLAKSVYVDENALLPGSARATFAHSDAITAYELAKELQALVSDSIDGHRDFRKWLAGQFDAIGADYYFHRFCPTNLSFSILGFLASSHTYGAGQHCVVEGREQAPGVNAVGIIRAPQGDGNEAIVLVTPFSLEHITNEDAVALGLSLALLRLLGRSLWLAKDVIWLAADSRYGKYPPVAAWLKEYHEPSGTDNTSANCGLTDIFEDLEGMPYIADDIRSVDIFKRAGAITAGFVLEFTPGVDKNVLKVHVEGSNGQMPNMDMISIVNLLVSWRQNLHLKLDGITTIESWQWPKSVGRIVETVGKTLAEYRRLLVSHTKASYTTAEDYVNGISVLANSCWKQMLGIPTGSHGAFRDFQLDAVTLQVISGNAGSLDLIMNFARLVEGVLRSINNLLEKFHASLFLYIMVSPNKFVSISTYMIPFGLLLVNFPIQAAALYSSAKSSTQKGWIQAVLVILVVESWSLWTAVLPSLLSGIFVSTSTKLAVWSLLSAASLCLAVSFPSFKSLEFAAGWYLPLKALTLALTGIALGILSAVNFSVALVGALLLLPICLSAQPLTVTWKLLTSPGAGLFSRLKALFAPILTVLPVLVALHILSLKDPFSLWAWIESMWFWGSSLYVSVFLVQLPCFVICLYILSS